MIRVLQRIRWVLGGIVLLGLGGCVTGQQMMDFTRSEFARVIADSLGRALQVYIQATT